MAGLLLRTFWSIMGNKNITIKDENQIKAKLYDTYLGYTIYEIKINDIEPIVNP
jgi:hypothetical protein